MIEAISFDCDKNHKEKLERIAADEHRTLAGQLRLVVEEWLEINKGKLR